MGDNLIIAQRGPTPTGPTAGSGATAGSTANPPAHPQPLPTPAAPTQKPKVGSGNAKFDNGAEVRFRNVIRNDYTNVLSLIKRYENDIPDIGSEEDAQLERIFASAEAPFIKHVGLEVKRRITAGGDSANIWDIRNGMLSELKKITKCENPDPAKDKCSLIDKSIEVNIDYKIEDKTLKLSNAQRADFIVQSILDKYKIEYQMDELNKIYKSLDGEMRAAIQNTQGVKTIVNEHVAILFKNSAYSNLEDQRSSILDKLNYPSNDNWDPELRKALREAVKAYAPTGKP
jgi:hypothetical protein